MVKRSLMKRILYAVICVLYTVNLTAQDTQNISGQIVDNKGDGISKTTVLLLQEDGTEAQRTQSSKKGIGRGGGKFEFKKVLSGKYSIEAESPDREKITINLEVKNKNLKLGKIGPAAKEDLPEDAGQELTIGEPVQDGPGASDVEFTPEPGKDYVLNELSFEIKKMTAELKYLNEEMENLKALSKMWVNPLAIYSKEIILKNGTTVFGKVVYQDEETIKIETLVGYLIINRKDVVRIIDNIVTEEQQEYVPEQVRDSYTPPPMPKLAEPKYTSGGTQREQDNKYSANCVLVGNISERKDNQGNVIFTGEVKNIGGRRSDFVKVDFVFRTNWSGETKTLTTFVRGGYHTFSSGITTDATLLPGASGSFELYVPHNFGSFIGYSYVIDWEEYQ